MTSPEATSNSLSLQIQSLLRQQGPVSVYKASVGSEEHLFYFYANPSEHSVLWLKDVLSIRTQMTQRFLPEINHIGWIEEGGYAWSVRLGAALSMRDLWDGEPNNALRSIRLVMQAVDAVVEMHAHGAFHGDIRAQNLWVQWDESRGERLCLTGEQLGLWHASEHWDESEMSIDSAECVSPEVVLGGLPTPASDIYSLGVLLYRALHGVVPFNKESAWEITASHATDDLERPELNPAIHDDLWNVIVRCLSKDPIARPTAHDLQQHLLPFVQYEQSVFVNLELTDPESIAEPTPPKSPIEHIGFIRDTQWTPIPPRSMQELAFHPARPHTPSVEEPEELEHTEEHTLKVERQPPIEDLTQKGVNISTPEHTLDVNPIKVMVGGIPKSSTTVDPTEPIESTHNIPVVSWLEDSSEQVVEAPVEFHTMNSHPALTDTIRRRKDDTQTAARPVTHENTGKVNAPTNRITSKIPQQVQFAVFMTLSSVITVLVLKIVEKILQ